MIGLDTNVIVRYVMQDDRGQSAKATKLIESLSADRPGFVSVVALVELTWVLSGSYGLNRSQIATVVEGLLHSQELRVDRADQVLQALRRYRAGADFPDALVERIGAHEGCEATLTFDRGAARTSGMRLVT